MKTKRTIYLFIALLICFSFVIPTFAYESGATLKKANKVEVKAITGSGTADSFRYDVIDNSYVEITKFIGLEADVVIPSEIGDYPVTSIGENAFSFCSALTSIEIPSNVKSIGDSAFHGCYSLTSIEIPNGITSISKGVFAYCSALTNIQIPNGVKSISERAFYSCRALKSIEIPDTVTSIGNEAFFGCDVLASIEIPSNVKSIGDSVFNGCYSLTSIEIPNGITSISKSVFAYCSALTNIQIPNGVKSIGERAFYSCRALKSIEIPDTVTSIGNESFFSCDVLASIKIPSSVETIGENAFFDCEILVLYGKEGSYVQSYANENNIPFVVISENENDFGISEESVYSIDEEKGILQGVLKETSLEKFISNFKNGNLAVTNANGEAITDENAFVGTGAIVNLIGENGNVQKTVTVLVMGDLGGDGRMNSRDIATLQRHLVEMKRLEGVYLLASDVKADGTLNSRDIAQLQKNIIG